MNLKEEIFKYLQENILMSVTTLNQDNSELWPAIVFYIADKDLNLYFMSGTKSKHCVNIQSNAKVAVSIYDSSQTLPSNKTGMQISGKAEVINRLESIKYMVKMWNQHIATTDDEKEEAKYFIEGAKSRIYKITPTHIKYFNQELFGKPPFQELQF